MPGLGVVWCVLSVIAVCAPPVPAQTISQGRLSDETIRSEPLTPEDEREVADFVERTLPLIETGNVKEMRNGKEALQDASRKPYASASFRRFYSQALLNRLNALALGEDTKRSVVAILIIGDLGTPQAVRALDEFLELDQNTQRFAAVVAYRSAFQSMAFPSSLIVGQAPAMIQNLGRLIEKDEMNPLVLDVCMRAMKTAADVGLDEGLPMGNLALDRLVTSVSARVRSLTPNDADTALFAPCVKATQDIRGVVTMQMVQNNANQSIVQSAGGLCGDLFDFVFRRVRQNKLAVIGPDANLAAVKDARKLEISALRIADDLVRLCKDELKVGDVNDPPVRLAPHIERGTKQGDQQYIRNVMELIGEGGLLTQPGFDLDSNRFLRGG